CDSSSDLDNRGGSSRHPFGTFLGFLPREPSASDPLGQRWTLERGQDYHDSNDEIREGGAGWTREIAACCARDGSPQWVRSSSLRQACRSPSVASSSSRSAGRPIT